MVMIAKKKPTKRGEPISPKVKAKVSERGSPIGRKVVRPPRPPRGKPSGRPKRKFGPITPKRGKPKFMKK